MEKLMDFKLSKKAFFLAHILNNIEGLNSEGLPYIKAIIDDTFNAGFDFGLDAAEQFLIPQKKTLDDPETVIAMVEQVLTRINEMRGINDDKPTPEQLAEYELEDRCSTIKATALRLLDMPHLYGEYMQRDQVIDMVIRDAVSLQAKVKEAVK